MKGRTFSFIPKILIDFTLPCKDLDHPQNVHDLIDSCYTGVALYRHKQTIVSIGRCLRRGKEGKRWMRMRMRINRLGIGIRQIPNDPERCYNKRMRTDSKVECETEMETQTQTQMQMWRDEGPDFERPLYNPVINDFTIPSRPFSTHIRPKLSPQVNPQQRRSKIKDQRSERGAEEPNKEDRSRSTNKESRKSKGKNIMMRGEETHLFHLHFLKPHHPPRQ